MLRLNYLDDFCHHSMFLNVISYLFCFNNYSLKFLRTISIKEYLKIDDGSKHDDIHVSVQIWDNINWDLVPLISQTPW